MTILTEPCFNSSSEFFDPTKLYKNLNHLNERVSFHTLGCRLNQSETDYLVRSFQQKGYEIVNNNEPADVCIINTCTVTENSDKKNRKIIRALNRLNPRAKIVVLGCYSQMNPKEISKIVGVNLIIGNQEKMNLHYYLEKVNFDSPPLVVNSKINKKDFCVPIIPNSSNSKVNFLKKNSVLISENFQNKPHDFITNLNEQIHPPISDIFLTNLNNNKNKNFFNNDHKITRTRSALKIQDGCDFMCSFCIIPFSRGRSRYREFSNLQKEALMLVEGGTREIVITGVNVGTYKTNKYNIVNVIDFLNTLKGLDRIRISSIEPTTVPEILLQYMKDSQNKLVPFLHLPIQSGSDQILKKMKRRYTSSEYADEIWRAFESVPDLCIGTDVMVGFPEESSIEFERTLKLLNKLPISYFHVFPFSSRKNTHANKIKCQIKIHEKNYRSNILRNLSSKKRFSFQKRFLGHTRDVLFESRNKDGNFNGYTDNFIKVLLEKREGYNYQNKIIPIELFNIRDDSVIGKYKSN